MKEKHGDVEGKHEPEAADEPQLDEVPAEENKFKRLWHWATNHKKLSIPLAIVFVLALLAAIPHTRYGIAGLFVKQTYPLIIIDTETNKPVSGAQVSLDGQKATTDNQGRASLRPSVGYADLKVSKKYYNSSAREVVVPFRKPGKPLEVKLKATGRPVPLTIIHKINKKVLANATITAEGTDAKTDKNGKATLVLPADKKEVKVKLSADGFNASEATLTVTTSEVSANTFELTPTGKLYFLSNQSGKIDVVKTNLDGSDRQTVLAGTGREDRYNTVLLASRDWKYLALHAKRDSDLAKLYLINTAADSLTVMDEGNASFTLSGWSGHYFVYYVSRNAVTHGQAKRQALKSYNAEAKKITTLDETQAEIVPFGSSYENYGSVYTFEDEVVFEKNLNTSGYGFRPAALTQATLNAVRLDGKNKKLLKGFGLTNDNFASNYLNSYPYEPRSIYFTDGNSKTFYEYEDGKVEELKDFSITRFEEEQSVYPTYLLSPSGKKNFWREERDGKSIIYIGNENGEDGKPVATLKNYQTYGWYTDDILFLSKDGSELYAMSSDGVKDEKQLIKITDYYKPAQTYRGYGGGYGGL